MTSPLKVCGGRVTRSANEVCSPSLNTSRSCLDSVAADAISPFDLLVFPSVEVPLRPRWQLALGEPRA